MAFWTGCGGHIEKVSGGAKLEVSKWTVRKTASKTVVKHSGNCDAPAVLLGGVEGTFTAEGPWDDTNLPDTDYGLDAGDSLAVKFMCGASGKFYQGTALVEDFQVSLDVEGVLTFTISGSISGAFTDPVT